MSKKYKRKTLEEYGWTGGTDVTNKKLILEFFCTRAASEKTVFYLFPELYDNVINESKLTTITSFPQKLYHYLNDDLDLELGTCKVCGARC